MFKQIAIHFVLGVATLAGTAAWVDRLLHIGQPIAQAVLTTDELKAVLDEPEAADEPKSAPPEPGGDHVAKPGAQPEPRVAAQGAAAASPPPEGGTASDATTSGGADVTLSSGEAPRGLPPEDGTTNGGTTNGGAVKADPQEGQPIRMADSTAEGGLVSFSAPGGNQSTGDGSATGGSAGLFFEIRLRPDLDWRTLHRVRGVLPVVVRQRAGFREVALVQDARVSSPVALDQLIASRPEYHGCWAIALPRERLFDLLEQTLNHGSGWVPGYLVEDRRFTEWMDAAWRFAQAQRQPPERVAGFQAEAFVVRAGEAFDLQLVFRNLLLKESAP